MITLDERDRPTSLSVFPSPAMVAEANLILRDWLGSGRSDWSVVDEAVNAVVIEILKLSRSDC